MKYIVSTIIILLLAGTLFVMRDTIFQIDESTDDTHDISDICRSDFNIEDIIEIEANSPNSFPHPEEEVGYVRSLDGGKFDYSKDRYLYRWRVAETYNASLADFEQNYEDVMNPYIEYQDFIEENTDNQRYFRISEQYNSLSNSFCGGAIVPWNSQLGGLVGPLSGINATVTNEGTMIKDSPLGYRDINEQPVLGAKFDTTLTQGFIEYDSYWVKEDKERISSDSISMEVLQAMLNRTIPNNYPTNRFGDLNTVNSAEMDGIWGLESLPGGRDYIDRTNPNADKFVSKYDTYTAILAENKNISTYDFILLIYNEIQNGVIQGLLDGSLNIDPTQTSGIADPGSDKAYWFYEALENPAIQFGMKEMLAGFTNMLRSFAIPARPVIGFSVGDFYSDGGTPGLHSDQLNDDTQCFTDNCDYIELNFNHIHVWIEALIPVETDNNTSYHWAMFNPIPDPWILQRDNNDWENGRNALGGRPDIEFEITTGNPTILPSPIVIDSLPTVDTMFVNNMGEDLTGRVRISYDGIPKIGETLSLRIVNETEMFTGDLSPEMGIELLSVMTNDANGWGNFKIFVDRKGQVFTYNSLNIINPLPISNLLIDQLNPFQSVETMGLYGIIAVYNMNFNGSLTGWDLNYNLNLNTNVTSSVMINPNNGQSIMSYVAEFGRTLEFSVTVMDNDSNVLEGIENIEFLLMKENDYNRFINSLEQQVLDVSLISTNRLGTFSKTNQSGIATIDITFNQTLIDFYSKPVNEVYVAIALIQNGIKYNPDPVFVWFEL